MPLYINQAGAALLESPLLNKGSAFAPLERERFNLEGLLPQAVETIEEQAERSYSQYCEFDKDITKYIYLRTIQDTNETLFYFLLNRHLKEMMPIIYTPTVGTACEGFSNNYRRARGLIIPYDGSERIDDILNNVQQNDIRIIVITDGERILGLGDQGIGGMGIPVGKLSLYTACGGIDPGLTLPVVLDVGTDNPKLLSDPMYMGGRHQRISGENYRKFVDVCIEGIKKRWPEAMVQFEDFSQKNAMPLLEEYQDRLCCFNDDIQGTAAVTVGTLLSACNASGEKLSDQRVAFLGAGSAGCGIAEAIVEQMKSEGLSDQAAREQVYMIDRWGLLTDDMSNLQSFQCDLVQLRQRVADWNSNDTTISLLDVIKHAKPTVLIGVSGQPSLFTEQVISEMSEYCERPIVLPLSNPTHRMEALPDEIIRWSKGKALVATGSPCEPVIYEGKCYEIAQCNNSYIFPGVGLGVLAVGAKRITAEMLMASSRALAECSPLIDNPNGTVLPPLESITEVSKRIAFEVAKVAMEEQVAPRQTEERIKEKINEQFWSPVYREYRRAAV